MIMKHIQVCLLKCLLYVFDCSHLTKNLALINEIEEALVFGVHFLSKTVPPDVISKKKGLVLA